MTRQPSTLAKGLYYAAALRGLGVPLLNGVSSFDVEGDTHVTAVQFTDGRGGKRRIECDAFAYGFGLKPEAQLADLAGCGFLFDTVSRQWLPKVDPDGRANEGIYLAGDGAHIRGADAAELSGRLAALAVVKDTGLADPHPDQIGTLRRKLARHTAFQKALAGAFAPPNGMAGSLPDDTIVCRCESITASSEERRVGKACGSPCRSPGSP